MKALSPSLLPRSARLLWLLLALAAAAAALPAHALRIKEVAAVQGVRSNQLTGYGLVVGLDGTGDQTTQMPYTTQAMSNYLQQMGISLPPGTANQLQLKNVAAVIVTAQLPAFAQPGQMIDINVSSMGNAKSLKGGTESANTFTGSITATVVDVLPNGHLVVTGEKQIGVNQNVDVLRFSGTVDPRALQPGSIVNSTQVANVRVESRGRGAQGEAQAMGWMGRFFNTITPF